MENRRNDKRIVIPGLQIRVRKHGSTNAATYVDCTPLDISFNGMAFSTSDLSLDLLQKIEIELSIESRILTGSAVVCDVSEDQGSVRYGILYIDITPSLDDLFGLSAMSSFKIRELAVKMADNVITNPNQSNDERSLEKARVLLIDGVEAFKERMCQRKKIVTDKDGKAYSLASLFEITDDRSGIVVPIKDTNAKSVTRQTIRPVIEANKVICFIAGDGRRFGSLVEFLQELSEAFELLFSEAHTED